MQSRTLGEMEEKLREIGIDPSSITARAELLAKAKGVQIAGKRRRGDEDEDEGEMDVDEAKDDDAWEDDEEEMDVDAPRTRSAKARKTNGGGRLSAALLSAATGVASVNKSGGRVTARAGAVRRPTKNRKTDGLKTKAQEDKATKLHDLSLRERNRHAKAGESDRANKEMLPKWLYTGKRGKGTSRSR